MEVLCQGEFKHDPKNIILIGFMGCGKSAIGKELSRILNYPLIDIDHEIEKTENKTIPEIFSEVGEAGFRQKETNLLDQLIAQNPSKSIISTGGGIVIAPENQKKLTNLGFTVWLSATPETIMQRIQGSSRPLLQTKDPLGTIKELLTQRESFYKNTAKVQIETDDLLIPEIASGVLETARYHFCR